jgi:glutamate-ammonia-ligase adenylyltransferase
MWTCCSPRPRGPTGKGLGNHEFFRRLAEAYVAEVGRATAEGTLYRIDLRLRPEGRAGPLARSLDSCENYYAQYGQTWERMMLIKGRRVAGDAGLAGEFLEMVGPFRFPRLLGAEAVAEIAAMKRRLENEVVRAGEQERNVKLGRGGIRDIEFVAQTRQVLHAGRLPFIVSAQTVPTLRKLAQYHLLGGEDCAALAAAYEFLRDVEHRLQMESNLQTHILPTERRARERLGRLMGFATLREFEARLETHRRAVREVYERVLEPETRTEGPANAETAFPELAGHEAFWKPLLAEHSFRDADQAFRLASTFVHGPGFGHVPARTEVAARRLLARFLARCPRRDTVEARRAAAGPDGDPRSRWLSDPDRVLARLDSFISAYGARALLFESWATQGALFELLLLLFDRSEFLAATAIRTPDLVDDLEQSGRLREVKTAAWTIEDLRHGAADADQRLWIRRYHETEFTRLGLRDILGLADFEQNVGELSALAEACLQYALEAALRECRLKSCPVAIIGLGKLGGSELNYGSDLDVVFVADDKARNLPALQRVAVTVLDLISSQTERGVAFELDARLRPDGEKGLLVNHLRAYGDYYRQRAQLWEIQAISRCRPVAGDAEVGARFASMVAELADFSRSDCPAVARAPDWKQQIARMRRRIEKERTPPGKEALAIKTGAGGLMDAEFLAQACCLEHGWREPNTLQALLRAANEGLFPPPAARSLLENYRRLRRVEGILRRWSYEGETELPDDPAPQYRVAVRCGFATKEDFLAAVARYRREVRAVYQGYFPPDPPPATAP